MSNTDTWAAQDERRTYTRHQTLAIMAGLMLGMMLAALDGTIVSTALTTISRDFHRPDLYSWVVTSYLLTSTVTTPLYGKISDQFGRKRIFQFAILVFLAGSALSGLSGSMYQLIIFRGVQGLGAGGLMSLAFSIVADVIPPRERGRYQGYFGSVFGAAAVLGPLVGGFLVDQASWRWVFYVNLPVGLVALLVINKVLRLDHRPRRAKIDFGGAVLLVAGMSLVLVGVQIVGEDATVTTSALVYATIGATVLVGFVTWEARRAEEPILPLPLLRNPAFSVASSVALIAGGIVQGSAIFLPQFLQLTRGVSPTVAGLRLLPMVTGTITMSMICGRLVTRTGHYKVFVVAGVTVNAVGIGLMSQISMTMNYWVLSVIVFVTGAGAGMFMQMLILVAQNGLKPSEIGVGTSGVTFFRTLGGAITAAAMGAILISQERTAKAHDIAVHGATLGPLYAFTHGLDRSYLWILPFSVLAVILTLCIKEVALRQREVTAPAATEKAASTVSS
jgi:EmrB/QacA subfamily drug resistance transporter